MGAPLRHWCFRFVVWAGLVAIAAGVLSLPVSGWVRAALLAAGAAIALGLAFRYVPAFDPLGRIRWRVPVGPNREKRCAITFDDGPSPRTGAVLDILAAEGVPAVCTGSGNEVVPGSSMIMVHFPVNGAALRSPEDLHDERKSNVTLREELLKLALLVHGVNVVHGGGAISAAHTGADLKSTAAAYGEAARLFKKFLY